MSNIKVDYFSKDIYCTEVANYLQSIQKVADESLYEDSWVDEIIITPLLKDRVLVVVKVCAMKEQGMK